jgi:DNA-binding transcriptional LysR family regulator
MDLNDAPLFVRIVQLGSFAAAAAELGVQRSSVSRSVTRLEESLGVRLLQRTTRQLALTDAGQVFFEQVRGAVASLDDAVNAVREFGGEPRGSVRLTAPGDVQTLGLAEAMTRFSRKYPGIHVELHLTGRMVDLVREGFDLAIRAGRLTDSALVARKIGPSWLALFAAPSYLKRAGTPKTIDELEKHDSLLFRTRASTLALTLTGPAGEVSAQLRGPMSADDMSFLYHACIAGAGLALLPVELARGAVLSGSLTRVLPGYYVGGGSVYIVMPSAALVPSRVALLRDHLFEHIKAVMEDARKDCAGVEKPCDEAAAHRPQGADASGAPPSGVPPSGRAASGDPLPGAPASAGAGPVGSSTANTTELSTGKPGPGASV